MYVCIHVYLYMCRERYIHGKLNIIILQIKIDRQTYNTCIFSGYIYIYIYRYIHTYNEYIDVHIFIELK